MAHQDDFGGDAAGLLADFVHMVVEEAVDVLDLFLEACKLRGPPLSVMFGGFETEE